MFAHDGVEDVAVGGVRDAAVGQLYPCRNLGVVLWVAQEGVNPFPAVGRGRGNCVVKYCSVPHVLWRL